VAFVCDGRVTARPPAVGGENFDAWIDLDGANAMTARRVFGAGFDAPVARQGAGGCGSVVRGGADGACDAVSGGGKSAPGGGPPHHTYGPDGIPVTPGGHLPGAAKQAPGAGPKFIGSSQGTSTGRIPLNDLPVTRQPSGNTWGGLISNPLAPLVPLAARMAAGGGWLSWLPLRGRHAHRDDLEPEDPGPGRRRDCPATLL
jgi:hypothetical protein